MLNKIAGLISEFFAIKAKTFRATGESFMKDWPPESLGYETGQVYVALAVCCETLAESFKL